MSRAQLAQQHIQGQMDDANVNAAETKLIAAATDALHGENGYMNKQGADALNSIDSYKQALAKAKKDIAGLARQRCTETDVRHARATASGDHRRSDGGTPSAAAQRVHLRRTGGRSRYRCHDDAASGDREQGPRVVPCDRSQAHTGRSGYSRDPRDSEEAKKAVRDVTTRITSGDISRLMTDNKYTEAKTLLSEQIKAGNVEPEAAKQLRATIESNVERVENINTADKIFASRKGLDATDLEDMLGKVDSQVKDPEQRKQVRSQVWRSSTPRLTPSSRQSMPTITAVVEYKYSHHGSLKGVDPVQWGMLDSKDRYELSKPPAVETDINTLYSFITKPDTLTVDNVKTAWGKGLLSKESFISLTEHAMMLGKDKSYVQEAGDINGRIDYFAKT
jgi:hypothetical protein